MWVKRKTEEQSFWKKLPVDFLCYNSCVWQPIATGGTYIESVDSLKLLVFTLPKIYHGLFTAIMLSRKPTEDSTPYEILGKWSASG